ncbi:TonB-dependent receptor [Chitinophaga silvatica]|uniref:TonB-dependent receptor n=1 Tax=Chitinophaga silvatica TaxID=2282649 RepID=A0A3E1Y751_9BACT|nr:outer membrane beta-barrel protein [Chitinophaga silvatica]RFS20731.1 TonB-dependent receptor [Chitinophaga silvatica]
MKIPYLIFLALIYINVKVQGQQIITGHIIDNETLIPLPGASIQFYRSIDSVRIKITSTDSNGKFHIDSVPAFQLYILVSYLGYENKMIEISNNKYPSLIALKRLQYNLSEIKIIGQKNPITAQKDTISFDPTFYKLNEEANLASILKKFPGFRFSSDGQVTYYGKNIDKIMINNHVYFGNDIKTALKNISADLISKIQLINKYTSELPSSEDLTEPEKILNIEIKNNKRNKFLGDVKGSIGEKGRFSSQLQINRFGVKNNLTLFISGNNLNGYLDGNYNSGQLIRNWEGGVGSGGSLSQKTKLDFNYKYGNTLTKSDQKVNREYLFNDSSYFYNQEIKQNGNIQYNLANLQFQYTLDSTTEISIVNSTNIEKKQQANNTTYQSLTSELNVVNSGSLFSNNTSTKYSLLNFISLNKKFNKLGRTATFVYSYETSKGKLNNYSITDNIIIDSYEKKTNLKTNQFSLDHSSLEKIHINFNFNEPLNKSINLTIYGGLNFDNSPTLKNTFNYDSITNSYKNIDDSLSISLKNRSKSQYFSLYFKGVLNKLAFTFAARYISINMTSLTKKSNLKSQYSILTPSGLIKYNFNNFKSIAINYDGGSTIPSFSQLNPIPDNSNPTLKREGNPNLKVGFSNNFKVSYSFQDFSQQKATIISWDVSLKNNQIVEGNWITNSGNQIIVPYNVDGIQNYSLNIINSIPIKKNIAQLESSSKIQYSINAFIINNYKESNKSISFDHNTNIKVFIEKKADLNIDGSIQYSHITRENQSGISTNLLAYNINMENNIFLPLNLFLNSGFYYSNLNNGNSNIHTFTTNLSISKEKLYNNHLILKLQIFDLFNQNTGNKRNIGINYVENINSVTFGRMILVNCILKMR